MIWQRTKIDFDLVPVKKEDRVSPEILPKINLYKIILYD